MKDTRDDEIAFLTDCREHPSVPTSAAWPRGTVFVFDTGPRRPRRGGRPKLYLVDLVIAVAVMAIGSVGMRSVAASLPQVAGRPERVRDYAACAVPLGVAAAMLLAIYRLRWARDRSVSPLQEPGFVAGVMLVVATGVSLLAYVYRALLYDIHIENCRKGPFTRPCPHPGWVAPDPRYLEGEFFRDVAGGCGLAVAVGWFVLLASCKGRPFRDWIDKAGCALGVFWIAVGIANLLD